MKKRDHTKVEDMDIEGFILLPALCACCCGLEVQQYVMLISAREDCVTRLSTAQSTAGATAVFTRCLGV